MRKALQSLVVVLIAIGLSFVTALADKSKITKESVVSKEKKRTYYLFVPETVKAPAPLIVLLHGSGHVGLSLVERWTELATKEGLIVAGPDSTNPVMWNAPKDGPELLYDLVEALKQKYPINPRRVYLFGHSAGATFGLQMSLLESQYFAAIAVHAGALPEKAYSNIDLAADKRKIPTAIFSGTDDQFVPISMVRATGDELRKRAFPVAVFEIPHHDHNYYVMAEKVNADAWEFLRKYELSEAPKYEPIQFR
jgi:poly(3-hydroxybutyrate) depolymerase